MHGKERDIASLELPCMPPDKPIRERLNEPVGEEGAFFLIDGRPCILFAEWDYAEDWSGEFVRPIEPPGAASPAQPLAAAEFWALVQSLLAVRPAGPR